MFISDIPPASGPPARRRPTATAVAQAEPPAAGSDGQLPAPRVRERLAEAWASAIDAEYEEVVEPLAAREDPDASAGRRRAEALRRYRRAALIDRSKGHRRLVDRVS